MLEVTSMSATELVERVKSGDLSAVEVTEAYIRRIEEVNPKLNAVVIPLFEEARATAAELDQKRARGEPLGLLHGVPVTIKEQYRVAGTQTTLGAVNKIGNVYHEEGPLVTKLRKEGAVILGKTNIIQTLANFESDNRVYGRSNNPWNLERSPGGSSGGEGAIVAAGGSALGLAGDYGGSTRIPAHFCGVQGLKPTTGRLSNADFPPDLFTGGQETVVPQPGPIARTVADLTLAMEVFVETSFGTTVDLVPPVPWRDPARVDISELRVGYYTDNGYFPAAPAMRRAVKEAAAALQDLGATVAPYEPPNIAEAVRIFLGVVSSDGGRDLKRLLGKEKPIPQMRNMLKGLSTPRPILRTLAKMMRSKGEKYTAFLMESVGGISAAEFFDLTEARMLLRHQFVQSLEKGGFDVILCPPFPVPAVTHGTCGDLFPAMSYTVPYNVIGAPAGVVAATRVRPGEESDRPVGKDPAEAVAREIERNSAGLPVGVQVVARHWREDIVLAVMGALEQHFRNTPDYPLAPAAIS